MAYQILARKYRPQSFADLTGQETTAKILRSALAQRRIAHAYLFSGPRGIGKTTCARILAKALNCHKSNSAGPENLTWDNMDPCNECDSCREITLGNSMDVMEIDAASHTQVENIREVVISTIALAPARDRFKIFIIDEVHMLSNHSFNALLKTLEEPPAHVVFILATTEFHKIPLTISSRAQRFRFLPLTPAEISRTIQTIAQSENIKVSESAAALIAKSGGGSMRDALSIFDQVLSHYPLTNGKENSRVELAQVEEILGVVEQDLLVRYLDEVSQSNARGALACLGDVLAKGYDLSYFLREVREAFREMLIQKCGYSDPGQAEFTNKKYPVDKMNLETLLRHTQLLTRCSEQMRWNDYPRLVMESFTVQMCQEMVPVKELLNRLEEWKTNRGDRAARLAAVPQTREVLTRSVPVAEKAPAPAVEKLEASDPLNPLESQRVWNQVLAFAQSEKPSMLQSLHLSRTQWFADRVELTLAKPFHLDTIKRHQKYLEDLLERILKKRLVVQLKAGKLEPLTQPPKEQVRTFEFADQRDEGKLEVPNDEEPDAAEDYGVVGEENENLKKQLAIEDQGAKIFLNVFSGPISKVEKNSEHGDESDEK